MGGAYGTYEKEIPRDLMGKHEELVVDKSIILKRIIKKYSEWE
jgi:hypothetical protein